MCLCLFVPSLLSVLYFMYASLFDVMADSQVLVGCLEGCLDELHVLVLPLQPLSGSFSAGLLQPLPDD